MIAIPRPGLSVLILAGVLAGMATGLLFGEQVTFLSLAGDIFVGLLQMTVLPYITLALISNIGRLSSKEGRRFGFYAGTFLLLSTALSLGPSCCCPYRCRTWSRLLFSARARCKSRRRWTS